MTTHCATDCTGIEIGDGNHSGCECLGAADCDCPNHPSSEKPGHCRVPMWWGDGMPAGLCGEPAFGPGIRVQWDCGRKFERDVFMACPQHGGPPLPEKLSPAPAAPLPSEVERLRK